MVRPLAEQVGATVLGELDVGNDAQIDATFKAKSGNCGAGWTCWWGVIAFAERENLRDRFLTVSCANFARSPDDGLLVAPDARCAASDGSARRRGDRHALATLGAVRAVPNYKCDKWRRRRWRLRVIWRWIWAARTSGSMRSARRWRAPCPRRRSRAITIWHEVERRSPLQRPMAIDLCRQDGRGAVERHVQRRHRTDRVR